MDAAGPTRTGSVADYTLAPPLRRRWSVRSRAFGLLAAGGRVFEIGPYSRLRARSARTGRLLWQDPGPYRFDVLPGAAYDRGILFAQGEESLVAIDARTGKRRWRHRLDGSVSGEQPVAAGGVVYAYESQGGGTVYAIRARDGRLLWSADTFSGSGGVALDGRRVYLAAACGNAQALDRRTGRTLWTHTTGCGGGGDTVARLYAGRVYVMEGEDTDTGTLGAPVLDAATGRVVSRWDPSALPAVISAGLGITLGDEALGVTARRVSTRKVAWRGRGSFARPLAVGHNLVGIGGRLIVADLATGLPMWAGRRWPFEFSGEPESGATAAANGMAFVSAAGRLRGYRSSLRPPARRVGFGAAPRDVLAGDWSVLVGVLGRQLRPGNPSVRITAARWRRGRFGRFGDVRSTGGGFRDYARVFRNTRFRASTRGRRSRTVTVYAFPAIRLGRPRQRGGLVHVRAKVRSPRTRLARHRLYLYLVRDRRARRLGGNRLRGRRGTARTTVRFRPLRRVRRRDRIYVCVRGAVRKGLGRPDNIGRHCGARRIRVRR